MEDHGVGHFAKLALNFASEKGWSEAAQAALDEAKKTINGILGVEEVLDKTAKVDPTSGHITGTALE